MSGRRQTIASWRRCARAVCAGTIVWLSAPRAAGHTIETSYCRIESNARGLFVSVAFDFSTLGWIAPADANEDGLVTPEELNAVSQSVEKFLRRFISIRHEGRILDLGTFLTVEWPSRTLPAIPESGFHQHFAVFRFQNSAPADRGEIEAGIHYFADVGKNHTVLGTIVANGTETRVIFTEAAPVRTFAPQSAEPRL